MPRECPTNDSQVVQTKYRNTLSYQFLTSVLLVTTPEVPQKAKNGSLMFWIRLLEVKSLLTLRPPGRRGQLFQKPA